MRCRFLLAGLHRVGVASKVWPFGDKSVKVSIWMRFSWLFADRRYPALRTSRPIFPKTRCARESQLNLLKRAARATVRVQPDFRLKRAARESRQNFPGSALRAKLVRTNFPNALRASGESCLSFLTKARGGAKLNPIFLCTRNTL